MTIELEELKSLWSEYDKKLDKSLELNLQLLHKINFDKAARKLGWLLFFKIFELTILSTIIVGLSAFTFTHLMEPQFCIPSLLITAFVLSGFVSDIRQMTIIVQIRANAALPVTSLQKKVAQLKLLIIKYTRTSFISVPFYPLLLIVTASMFFKVDLWGPHFYKYLMVNILLGVALLPLFLWLFRKLKKQDLNNTVAQTFLSGSGWNQAVLAQRFLDEIEQFENGIDHGV